MSKVEEQKKEPLFQELDADKDDGPVTVESYCVNCGENVSKTQCGELFSVVINNN